VLARMWRKRNPRALLVGMQTGAANLENSMEVPPKVKNRTTLFSRERGKPRNSAIALPGIYPKNTETLIQTDTCTLMFIAA